MTAEMRRRNERPKSEQRAAPKRKRADTGSSTEPVTTSNKRQCLTKSLCLTAGDDAKIMDTIDARYEVQLQSVISSSKMQNRVTAILRHLTPPTPSSADETVTTTKTRVSILRAKAADAGKLVSIAEIAKREIEKELPAGTDGKDDAGDDAGQGSTTDRWYQYIALGEELVQGPRNEGNTIIEETVLGDAGKNKKGNHGDDDEFEVMKTPFERAIEGKPLLRGVPIMSLFLSRSPIEELKKRYGEQTNALPT